MPATKTATHLLKTSQKYCACHAKRFSTRCKTRLNVTKCHACHAKRSNDTSETSKNDHLCRTSHRHGHTEFVRTVADGCERLRTVANGSATSSEHTLNPQTPRVKREPLLRIPEKLGLGNAAYTLLDKLHMTSFLQSFNTGVCIKFHSIHKNICPRSLQDKGRNPKLASNFT